MARSAALAACSYHGGSTRPFDMSTERSTRGGDVQQQLLAGFRENGPDCMGRPFGPHTNFAASYIWESSSSLLLTKLHAVWLISSSLGHEKRQHWTRKGVSVVRRIPLRSGVPIKFGSVRPQGLHFPRRDLSGPTWRPVRLPRERRQRVADPQECRGVAWWVRALQ